MLRGWTPTSGRREPLKGFKWGRPADMAFNNPSGQAVESALWGASETSGCQLGAFAVINIRINTGSDQMGFKPRWRR